ncbi:MAG: cellulose synthase operon protein YhjQ/BcsQ [Polyangiales bacterium]
MTRHIVITSPKGGVGRTTLVAQLATRLTARGKRCLAIDLDPQNTLALQLGASPTAWLNANQPGAASAAHTVGIVNLELTAHALAEHLRARRAYVAHVPFGTHQSVSRRRAEAELTVDPRKLRARITTLAPPRCELVLIDTPAGQNAWAESALALADLVLVPLLAEPASLAAVPAWEAYLRAHAPAAYPQRVQYLINRWNPTQQVACDVFNVLSASLPGRVSQRGVFDDEQLREALARGEPQLQDAGSQAASDFESLADSVLEQIEPEAFAS